MIKKIWQCCYTNATREAGGTISSGWQAVAVSPDIPAEAYRACTKIQNSHSFIQGAMLDETGNILNLLDISGDGSYLYIIRTQYGLHDRLGRPNMFSHAYVLPCQDSSSVENPNLFLTLANSNFKTSEEEAEKEIEEPERLEDFTIHSALQQAKLNKSTYKTLIQCVYAQMTDKNITSPLYLQYDGDEMTLRAILYCIYFALPFSLRKRLSAASAKTDNTGGKTIVFSKEASSQARFLEPSSGENNVLTDRLKRRFSQLNFLDFTVNYYENPEVQNYFKRLETRAIQLGDAAAMNELILKISDIQIWNELRPTSTVSKEELAVRISDALRSKSLKNERMDDYIAGLLENIIENEMILTEESVAMLLDRVKQSSSQAIREAAEKYQLHRLCKLSIDEAMQELDSWDKLQDVVAKAKRFPENRLMDKIDEIARNLYEKGLKAVETGRIEEAVTEYTQYMAVLQERMGKAGAEKCEIAAKEAFWDLVNYDNLCFDHLSEYKKMEFKHTKCEEMLMYCDLITPAKNDRAMLFLGKANLFFNRKNISEEAKQEAVQHKLREAAKKYLTDPDKYFDKWCKIFFETKEQKAFEELCNVFQMYQSKEEAKIMSAFRRYWKQVEEKEESRKDIQEISGIFLSFFAEKDDKNQPISLDTWLILGKVRYGNAFRVFDYHTAFILEADKKQVVSESECLKEESFQEEANIYVEEKGKEFRVVKKWLSAFRKGEPEPEGAERGKEAAGFLQKFFGKKS